MEGSHEAKLHIRSNLGHIEPVKSTYSKIDGKDSHTHDNYSLSSVLLVDWISKKPEKSSGQSLSYQVQISSFKFKYNDWSTTPTNKGTDTNNLSSQVSFDLLFPWDRFVHNSDHPVRENVENINGSVLAKSRNCASYYCTLSVFGTADTIAIGALSFILLFHLFLQGMQNSLSIFAFIIEFINKPHCCCLVVLAQVEHDRVLFNEAAHVDKHKAIEYDW